MGTMAPSHKASDGLAPIRKLHSTRENSKDNASRTAMRFIP
jgi:hypothetical protein